MPCRYYTEAEEKRIAEEANGDLQRELDFVTRLLCEVCSDMAKSKMSGKLSSWYAAHKKMDAQRLAAEKREAAKFNREQKARQRALAKLTPAEKKMLGVQG